jgi:hypothetical protein
MMHMENIDQDNAASQHLCQEDRILETNATRHRDFVLEDYEPISDPVGSLHPASVLRYALREAGLFDEFWPIVERIREAIGHDETVWGIKRAGEGPLLFELYFYNKMKKSAGCGKSATGLSKLLAPFMTINSLVDEAIPYSMCSLDLDKPLAESKQSSGFRIYIGGASDARRHESFSYLVSGSDYLLENHYTFYYIPWEMPEVRDRLSFSVRSGDTDSQIALLPEPLYDCYKIYYSTKPRYDGIYFSRVNTQQLIWFMSRYFPGSIHKMLQHHILELGHLRWDVAYDFTRPSPYTRTTNIEKVAFYGIV